jgi:hypothetical protein
MRSAIRLWEYFAGHAKKAFAVMYESEETRVARKLLRWVERTGVAEFTQRDAWKGTEGGLVKTVADLVPVLKMMSERGYLRPLANERSGRPGRPHSPSYAVNPAWRAANIAKNQQGSGLQDQNLRENAVVEDVSKVGPQDAGLEASESGPTLKGGQSDALANLDRLAQRCQVCEQVILGEDRQTGLPWHESCRPEPTPEELDAEQSEEVWT